MYTLLYAHLFASCLLCIASGAPAPAPGPAVVYQRPINGDCPVDISSNATVSSGRINYYPTQFYIQGNNSGPSDQVTVRCCRDIRNVTIINHSALTARPQFIFCSMSQVYQQIEWYCKTLLALAQQHILSPSSCVSNFSQLYIQSLIGLDWHARAQRYCR